MSEYAVTECLGFMKPLADDLFTLTVGSPPYANKGGRYGGKKKWPTGGWVDWMVDITTEAVRVTEGYVLWVVNGSVKNGCYEPACEMLLARMHAQGIICERPLIWHKNAPPNRKDWFGNDWEYILAFKSPGAKQFFDWEALGTPPKYKSGGQFRQRTGTGKRRLGSGYPQGRLARPRDVRRYTVGGGHMGFDAEDSRLCSDGEAPYPLSLVTDLIKACCPMAGWVFDPFGGSGSTAVGCEMLDRKWTLCDVRQSQHDLAMRRLDRLHSLKGEK